MKTKQATKRKSGAAVRSSDMFCGKGYTLSFPPIGGGMVCCRADKAKWTFRTMTDVIGTTRYHIGYVDKHSESWNEVTKATFVKAQKTLRARLPQNDPS